MLYVSIIRDECLATSATAQGLIINLPELLALTWSSEQLNA